MVKVTEINNTEVINEQIKKYVRLDLEPKAAEALFAILQKIGGDPDTSSRKFFDEILEGMQDLGFSRVGKFFDNDGFVYEKSVTFQNGISFKDEI